MRSSPSSAGAASGAAAEPAAAPTPAAPPDIAPDALHIRQRRWIKRLLPQSMFGRSLLLIVMPIVLLQIIATWIFYDRHWEAVSYRLSADVAGDIAMTIDSMTEIHSAADRDSLFARVAAVSDLALTWRPGAALPAGKPAGGTILETQLRHAMVGLVAAIVLTIGVLGPHVALMNTALIKFTPTSRCCSP